MTEIERLRELLAKGSPGPWKSVTPWVMDGHGKAPIPHAEDAALIVAAVNALPSLLGRLEALEAVAEAAQKFMRITDEHARLIDALARLEATP